MSETTEILIGKYQQTLEFLKDTKSTTQVLHPLDSGNEFFVEANIYPEDNLEVEIDLSGNGDFRKMTRDKAIRFVTQRIKQLEVAKGMSS